MIDEDRTIQLFGYKSTDLKLQSHKPIVRVCDGCGRYQVVRKQDYHDLCISCSHKKRYEDPLEREKQSKRQLKRYEDPLEHEKSSKGQKKRYEDPNERQKTGKTVRQAHIDDPTISQRKSISHLKRWAEIDNPGLEMVTHHYIYDFNDLSKYTIEVTRSEHATIHNNLRFIGLEVPHINIMKDE